MPGPEAFDAFMTFADSADSAGGGGEEVARSYSDYGLVEPSRTELLYPSEGEEYLKDLRRVLNDMINSNDPKEVAIRGELIQLRNELNTIIRNGIPEGEVRTVVMEAFNDVNNAIGRTI